MQQNRSYGKTVGIIALCVLLTAIAVWLAVMFFGGVHGISEEASVVRSSNVRSDSNLSNWGFVCEADGTVYYSDFSMGLYAIDGEEARFLSDGIYSDLCVLGDQIVGVCYPEGETVQLVSVNRTRGETRVLFEAPFGTQYIQMLHHDDSDLYFSLDGDALYTVNLSGRVNAVGVNHVTKVTHSGIYASRYPNSGLRLLSENLEELRVFDRLDRYNVAVLFETETALYLRLTELADYNVVSYAVYDLKTEELSVIDIPDSFGALQTLAMDGDQLFGLCSDGQLCNIIGLSQDGKLYAVIDTVEAPNAPIVLLSLTEEKAYLSFPYSECEPKWVSLSE